MAATLRFNNVCDVPIDMDNNFDEIELSPVFEGGNIDMGPKDDNAPPSSWSSSSGSFYDELETSPIGVGSTWYWHSPSDQPLDKPNWCKSSPNGGYTLQTTDEGSQEKQKMQLQTHENALKSSKVRTAGPMAVALILPRHFSISADGRIALPPNCQWPLTNAEKIFDGEKVDEHS